MRSHQIGGDLAGAVLTHHAAEQQLPGVGAADLAGLLGPIERERIGAEFLAPECFLKSFGEPFCFSLQLLCQLAFAEPQRATRRQPLAGEHIALHFGKRDIAFG